MQQVKLTRDKMMPMIFEACPSFIPKYEAEVEYYEGEVILYNLLGDLATHLRELHRQGKESEFPAVSAIVEQWLIEGDDYVINAAVIGFLESIQNTWNDEDTTPEEFVPYLQPLSKKWWDYLNDWWDGKELPKEYPAL
jgi:hypothetical protein